MTNWELHIRFQTILKILKVLKSFVNFLANVVCFLKRILFWILIGSCPFQSPPYHAIQNMFLNTKLHKSSIVIRFLFIFYNNRITFFYEGLNFKSLHKMFSSVFYTNDIKPFSAIKLLFLLQKMKIKLIILKVSPTGGYF